MPMAITKMKTALIHVPVRKELAAAWSKFRKKNGLFILARDAEAMARGLNAREFLMERALVEYMANHAGGN